MIMTHRCLDDVLPSFCSLAWAYNGIHFDENDSKARAVSTARAVRHIDKSVESIVKFRSRPHQLNSSSQKNIFDVIYDDLMKQPVDTVRRIYDHFNLHWSSEFEEAMNIWLRDNPQGKHGRHTYNLVEYGFNHDDIEKRYADYINLFLCSSSLDRINTGKSSST